VLTRGNIPERIWWWVPLSPKQSLPVQVQLPFQCRKAHERETAKISCMKQWIKDTAGLGTGLWLIGYLASLVLFFSPYAGIMGWILLIIFTPVTIAVTWWWFRQRKGLSLQYYAKVGTAWVLIAIVFDYLFIVQLFQATYYEADVFVYYALTFLIPVGVGLYLVQNQNRL
jgi:hypothetical protein